MATSSLPGLRRHQRGADLRRREGGQPVRVSEHASWRVRGSIPDRYVGCLPYAVCHTAKWLKSSSNPNSPKFVELRSAAGGSGGRTEYVLAKGVRRLRPAR